MDEHDRGAAPDAAPPDFAAMYRELGLDATCSLAELRLARRRRVARLHPDLGGTAEDTGRLQQLNRSYTAALDFHARFGRLPGAPAPGLRGPRPAAAPAAPAPPEPPAWRRADAPVASHPAAGFGRMSRYPRATAAVMAATFVVALVAAVGIGAVRDATGDAGPALSGGLATGQDKDTVRKRLGEPLDMHAQRWQYGPSWVDFRCDRVAGWHSTAERALPVDVADVTPSSDAEGTCE
jgi:hypothetical protein